MHVFQLRLFATQDEQRVPLGNLRVGQDDLRGLSASDDVGAVFQHAPARHFLAGIYEIQVKSHARSLLSDDRLALVVQLFDLALYLLEVHRGQLALVGRVVRIA